MRLGSDKAKEIAKEAEVILLRTAHNIDEVMCPRFLSHCGRS